MNSLILFSPRFHLHRNPRGKIHLSVDIEQASIQTLWTLCGKDQPPLASEREIAVDLVCHVCLHGLQKYQRGKDFVIEEEKQA